MIFEQLKKENFGPNIRLWLLASKMEEIGIWWKTPEPSLTRQLRVTAATFPLTQSHIYQTKEEHTEEEGMRQLRRVKKRVEHLLNEAKERGIIVDYTNLQANSEAQSITGFAYYQENNPKRAKRPPEVLRLKEELQRIEDESDTVILVLFLPNFNQSRSHANAKGS